MLKVSEELFVELFVVFLSIDDIEDEEFFPLFVLLGLVFNFDKI
jgi:hypothetical protein